MAKAEAGEGFSLLEVVIGVFIVLVTLGSVSAVFTLQDRAFHKYRDTNMVRFVAESEMERLLSFGFTVIPDKLGPYPKTVEVERLVDAAVSRSAYIVDAAFIERADEESGELIITATHRDKPDVKVVLRTALYKTS